MSKFIPVFILAIFGFQFASGQLSEKQLEDGYQYYNTRKASIPPLQILPKHTLNPNKLEFVSSWMNIDSIKKNFKSQRVIIDGRFQHLNIDLDSIFGPAETKSLNEKIKNLKSVMLDPKLLKSDYKLSDSSFFMKAFPIIQEGRDSISYALIYEESDHWQAFGRIRIEKQAEDDWLWFGSVIVPRFDIVKITNQLKNLPEEYQVINSFLIGKDALIQSKFIPINGGGDNYDRYSEFETWDKIQNSSLDEDIDVRKHFSKSNLASITKYLNSDPKGSIDKSFLLGNLKSLDATNKIKYGIYKISKPFIFHSDIDNCYYAIFYWAKVDGPLNGSGNILVMKKENGRYVKFLSHMLWIS
ncbi:hypothetical protein ML462_10785 [Gramella lutea]|uniref:Uncharacterized protein n=1 Tax=Christiangramia lutea TaxID=1607951 RepID=A0A9X1V4S9_9FLAO|nr:hypothetical protein [Christiangramia lutea]MCH4823656.1 hypothetical protein [Christiangramia lutea]